MSERALLTTNQHRHLETVGRLLVEALGELIRLPVPENEAHWIRVREQIRTIQASVEHMAAHFDLVVGKPVDPMRRVRAVASAWASELGGMTAAKLAGYGPVHPNLAAVLDRHVELLRRQLFDLVEAASDEGEHAG